jgi:hypothetical protein
MGLRLAVGSWLEAGEGGVMLTVKQLLILLAWEAGEFTASQAARLLGKPIVDARALRLKALKLAERLWEEYRKKNPVTGGK